MGSRRGRRNEERFRRQICPDIQRQQAQKTQTRLRTRYGIRQETRPETRPETRLRTRLETRLETGLETRLETSIVLYGMFLASTLVCILFACLSCLLYFSVTCSRLSCDLQLTNRFAEKDTKGWTHHNLHRWTHHGWQHKRNKDNNKCKRRKSNAKRFSSKFSTRGLN